MTPDEQARRERAQQLLACVQDGPIAHTQEDIMLSFAASEVRRALDELAKPGGLSGRDLQRLSFVCPKGVEELVGLRAKVAIAEQENAALQKSADAWRDKWASATADYHDADKAGREAREEAKALRHQLERYQCGCAILPDGTEALKTIKELRVEVERKDTALEALARPLRRVAKAGCFHLFQNDVHGTDYLSCKDTFERHDQWCAACTAQAQLDAAVASEPSKPEDHDENCDTLQLGPDLGPSTKPCNCHHITATRAPDASKEPTT